MYNNSFNQQLSTTLLNTIYLIILRNNLVEIYEIDGYIFEIKSALFFRLNQKKEHMEN